MAAASGAKENAAPSPAAATASAVAAPSRRHCYAVKSCGVKKRPSKPRWLGRVPLRDITNLIVASSAVAELEARLGQEVSPATATGLAEPGAVLQAEARVAPVLDGVSAGPEARAARYSLRKGFR